MQLPAFSGGVDLRDALREFTAGKNQVHECCTVVVLIMSWRRAGLAEP